MKLSKIVLALLAAAFIVIQFIRPERNTPSSPTAEAAPAPLPIPDEVRQVLQTSCFDCHSNTTRYPWYAEIQPVGWWLAGHIRNAKQELNFDEFSAYPARRKFAKLRQIEEQITEGEMPLPAYTIIHRDAILPTEKKELLIAWTRAVEDSLRAAYPPDSLNRRSPR
ncbi:MAG: heme-binding domain-containing protein [Bacteroidota bacterium]